MTFYPTHTNLTTLRKVLTAKLHEQLNRQQFQDAHRTLTSLQMVTRSLIKRGW